MILGPLHYGTMQPPRWFYPFLAACLVSVTVAAVLNLRWKPAGGATLTIDTWRGAICHRRGCEPLRWPVQADTGQRP